MATESVTENIPPELYQLAGIV